MTTVGYGMQSHVLFQKQNSFGTLLTDSLNAIPFRTENIEYTIEQLAEENMYQRFAESPYHEGVHVVRGSVTLDANPISIGFLLRAMTGGVTTTSDTNKQSHLFTPATADFDDKAALTPFTLQVHRDVGSAEVYFDLVANQIQFNAAQGALLSVQFDVVGASRSRKEAGSPTFTIDKPFIWDQASLQFNGWAVDNFRDLTITLNNNVDAVYTLGNSKTPHRIKRTRSYEVTVGGTVQFETHSMWDAFLNQDETKFVAHFASSQAPNALTIDIPSLRLSSFPPQVAGPGLIEASFEGRGVYNTGSAQSIAITLVNCHVVY